MKKYFLISMAFFSVLQVKSQTNREKQIMIIPCKSGTLIIDGVSIGLFEANDVSKQLLSFGEHYLQLKLNTEKINLSVVIDENTKSIIKLGCETKTEISGVRLINKQLSLSGLLSNNLEDNIIGLDKEDEIVINASIINKNGTANIFIYEINNGNEIFRKQDFKILENEKIKITSRGIYKISFYTDALFGKEAKLTIDRIPSKSSSVTFNTVPIRVYDTTAIEVLKTITRVYSAGNFDHPNRTSVSIALPANTNYWTYWIGVDQEAQNSMKDFIKNLSPILSTFSSNPLVLYGMKLIPLLPMVQSSATVDYMFTDTKNATAFVSGRPYSYYTFKHADNVSADYSFVRTTTTDLVLNLKNESTFTGHNVDIRVVAFVVKSRLTLQE